MKRILLFLCVVASLAARGQGKKIIVAQDGTGDFRTVQAAFDAVPLSNRKPVIIYVKNGVYQEKLRLDSSKNFVTLWQRLHNHRRALYSRRRALEGS